MLDIKAIRQNPNLFHKGFEKRGLDPHDIDRFLNIDEEIRTKKTELQELQKEKNALAASMASADQQKRQFILERGQEIKQKIQKYEKDLRSLDIDLLLGQYPNIPDESVPFGKNEHDNVVIDTWGTIRQFDFEPKEHSAIMPDLMDFESASRVSGSRFVYLKGVTAQLHRALSNFFLDTLTKEFGYLEMYTPYLVKDSAMFGTGQLPKFHDDQFQTTDGRWLIPTAEVTLTNYVREQILSELPLRFTAATPCFRKEAGAAGKDMRGMIRQHQFNKVEMVSITTPEQSQAEHERMTNVAQTLLQRLNLPYRKILLCTGDMGFSACKTYDLEVWVPFQNTYREISSCSNCGDFQARRMNVRYRDVEQKVQFCHTLNGSGLPVGRTLIAVLENYQNEDGTITIPDVLKKYIA